MATSNRDFMSRMNKRNNLAMAMLKRPNESDVRSTTSSNDQRRTPSPSSVKSIHSAGESSLASCDDVYVLEMQYKKNQAQIHANEERMRHLQAADDRMVIDIRERLSAVMQLNQQLSFLQDMLSRAERVSRGEFGIQVNAREGLNY